ncbi:hypothetical protein A0H81_13450 [Grifola frondosa]|uniref:Uncharacterized protein n=1 Tax=Grifola frondosa TaxID=5627 RepID=A0A1C7LP41_GRIFR|nr:hypothetical protein A0H81_13450 [Grifola frondosa]
MLLDFKHSVINISLNRLLTYKQTGYRHAHPPCWSPIFRVQQDRSCQNVLPYPPHIHEVVFLASYNHQPTYGLLKSRVSIRYQLIP